MAMTFILKDISYKSFAKAGEPADYGPKGSAADKFNEFFRPGGPSWSYALACSGTNQNTMLNPTGPPGFCLGIFVSMMPDLPKDNWKLFKVEETLDVTPVHHQYYELTHGRKEALEAKIREGLVKISQSIADLELVEHDLLKYEDFEEQLEKAEIKIDKKASHEEQEEKEKEKRKAEMALKTTFMEEVDYHAGGSGAQGPGRLSMAFLRNHNIMPTVVDDFFRMEKKEDLEKDKMLKDLPTVEKRMLEVKWGAYEDWLRFFSSNVKRRMDALNSLKKSREKTLEEYREWLKPSIARYKMLEDTFETSSGRKKRMVSTLRLNAQAVSIHEVKVWFWKGFVPPDPHRPPAEEIEKAGVVAFGNWERDNFYLHPDSGLVSDYPWITEEWIFSKAEMKGWGNKSKMQQLNESEWYYSFQELVLERANFKTSATGAEVEDGEFSFVNYMFSKNVVAAKIMELEAKKEELEIYIDDMLGLPHEVKGRPIIIYKKDKDYEIDATHYGRIRNFKFIVGKDKIDGKKFPSEMSFTTKKDLEKAFPKEKFQLIERKKENKTFEDIKKILGLENVRFFLNRGPYEQNFSERVKKYYLKPNDARFQYVRSFIMKRMKIDYGD